MNPKSYLKFRLRFNIILGILNVMFAFIKPTYFSLVNLGIGFFCLWQATRVQDDLNAIEEFENLINEHIKAEEEKKDKENREP